jgi:hypothetical protein
MSNGVACSTCGGFVASARAGCAACGPAKVPGVYNLRQAAAFVTGSAGIALLALGMVVAFARAVPGLNEAVGRVIRRVFGAG